MVDEERDETEDRHGAPSRGVLILRSRSRSAAAAFAAPVPRTLYPATWSSDATRDFGSGRLFRRGPSSRDDGARRRALANDGALPQATRRLAWRNDAGGR